MAREDSGAAGNILLAFLLGAAAGAALALLYAPQSGDKTRRFLSEKAKQGREQVAEAVERGREAFEQARESL
jgi:gas vesicle protein